MKIIRVTASNVEDAIRACKQAEAIGLDTETTALHPKDGKLRLIQLAVGTTCYVLDAFRDDPRLLLPVFDGESILVGHNLAFDLRFLSSVGIDLPHGKKIFDTMLAGQILDAGILPRRSHSLAAMVEEYGIGTLDKTEQKSDWSGTLTQGQVAYAAKDAIILLPLYRELHNQLKCANLIRTMNLEMRALPGIAWLGNCGMPVDRGMWNTLAEKNKHYAESIEMDLAELTETADIHGFSTINWRSPAQVVATFNQRFLDEGRMVKVTTESFCREERCNNYGGPCNYHGMKQEEEVPFTINNADDETLTSLAVDGDDLAKLLLKNRKAVKLRDTYGRNWSSQFIESNGLVYPEYRQIGAFSGRMACTNPNCQQIPHSFDFRSCVRPQREDEVFVISDYSQIELRITVDKSKDPVGLQAYCVDETDLHRATAELILGVDLKNDTKERIAEARQVAKSLNFGLIFGAGSETMRKYALSAFGVNLGPKQAVKLRNAWRSTYAGITAWQRQVKDGVETIYTAGGRRRLNVDKFTEKLNTPVQGTGADGLKAAIALCYERRHMIPTTSRPFEYVHDEIGFISRREDAESVKMWLKHNMEEGMNHFMTNVPAVAEPHVAESWAEK